MCDLPEDLQIIKRERSPSLTPEEKSPNSIKAKLNLHVKRRLQDYNQTTEDSPSKATQCKQLDTPKTETVRQKRPYHKRADKNKTNNPTTTATTGETSLTAAAASLGIATTTTPQRKYKHKIKQITTNTSENHQEHNNTEEQTAAAVAHYNTALTTGAVSAGDEDEGGHDNDMKTMREKEKCPDVLAMVLSMKKRALMQDPDVQTFLKDIMDVIKS